MTGKRFEVYDDGFSKHIEDTDYTEDKHEHNLYDIWEMCRRLNELHEENNQLKNSLKEFGVVEIDRIKGAVVTNDDFSVALRYNNEAYMVCNMINRFIRSVKNGSKD